MEAASRTLLFFACLFRAIQKIIEVNYVLNAWKRFFFLSRRRRRRQLKIYIIAQNIDTEIWISIQIGVDFAWNSCLRFLIVLGKELNFIFPIANLWFNSKVILLSIWYRYYEINLCFSFRQKFFHNDKRWTRQIDLLMINFCEWMKNFYY